MEATNPITRLTEREKEALRAWLDHKSAKEIALDLGITHHAVEKRLKMARTKLDAGSSLEAARMLAQSEGCGHAVAHLPDLEIPAQPGESRWTSPLVIGTAAMSLFAAAAIVLFAQSGTAEMVLKPGDLLLVAPTTFDQLDTDRSGFLEGNEAPPLIRASGNPSYTTKGDGTAELVSDQFVIDTSVLRDSFYKKADTDGDRKVSRSEYEAWVKPAKREVNDRSEAE